METHLVQFSVVVVGRTHNPSILNPDFLAINGIVPHEWKWEVVDTITTPPLAMVRYTNGVTISVAPDKLQVVDVSDKPEPSSSRIVAIARQYTETLPHVRYTAVGVNFQSIAEQPEPGRFLKERFLRSGPWDGFDHLLQDAGLRLVYPVADGRLLLSLDAGEADKAAEGGAKRVPVLIVVGNFHRDCRDYPSKDQVSNHLTHVSDDWTFYGKVLADILG